MSQSYMDPFDTPFVGELEEIDCPCQGEGWAHINGSYHECGIHYYGQLHPDSKTLLLDEPAKLAEAEKASVLKWKIDNAREEVRKLTVALKLAQHSLHLLELEQINKTPTIQMRVVIPEEAK